MKIQKPTINTAGRTSASLIAMLTLLLAGAACANDTVVVPMNITVQTVLSLDISVRKSGDSASAVSQMNFGSMIDGEGENAYDVIVVTHTAGRPYTLEQTAQPPTDGTHSLPAGVCVVTPWSTDGYGRPYPAGAKPGNRGSFATGNKTLLYTSGPDGASAAVAMTYAITSKAELGATAQVPENQPAGNYASSVTFQIVLAE